uniref:SJCHGC09351 protein n=1 Tax=Schistosoma japonicum TaxID=6182 RepID=Q5DFE2_SCHJA|nr:SJCHGC09351 protein [Schistosoma japonicum]
MCGLQALEDIKKLAEDDSRYTALMKPLSQDKTTLQGLVLLLSNKNKSIVSLVLQILIIIRRRPGGDDVLRSLLGLSEQLNDLKKSTNSIDNEDKRLISNSAEELLSLFNCSTKQNSPKPIKANPEKAHFISRPKSVILQLRGLTSEVISK